MSADIKTWQERLGQFGTFLTPHNLYSGFAAREASRDAEIADLRALVEKYEARMLRMATCAGEFARDACKVAAATAPQPDAEAYDEMLRAFICRYAAGGYNSDGLMHPETAREKLEWIVEDARLHAAPQPVAGDERGLFEAGGSPRGYVRHPGAHSYVYVDSITQAQWEGWQASAAQSARQIAALHAVIGELTAEREDAKRWRKARSLLVTNDFPANWLRAQSAGEVDRRLDSLGVCAAAPAAPTGSGE